MTAVEFEVVGLPAPQGSHKAFVVAGKARITEAAGQRHVAWRDSAASAARDVAASLQDAPLDGPLHLDVTFRFPCPTSRPKAHRTAASTPVGAPKTTAPDLDKLVRALCDALTAGGLIVDDARISRITAEKAEVTGWTGAIVTIHHLEEAT